MASIKPYTLKKSGETRYEVFISNGINSGTGRQEKVHKKGFKSWDEANTYAKILEGKMASGEYQKANPSKMTIGNYMDMWITEYKSNVKEGTRITYRNNIKYYIKPYIGNFQLEKYKSSDHQKFINKLFDQKTGKNKDGLSYKSVEIINATVSNAFKKAIQLGYVSSNPTKYVEFKREAKSKKKEPDHYSTNEVDKFLEVSKQQKDPLWYPFFLLVFDCGLRKGEILGLRWSDLNMSTNFIRIERERLLNAEEEKKNDVIILDDTKTPSGTREIPMTERTKQALSAYYSYFNNLIGYTPLMNKNDSLIFIHSCGRAKGKPVRTNTVTYINRTIAEKANLKRIRVHDGRHTFAIRMRQAGVGLEDIKDLLGHKDLSTTQIYASITPEVKQKSMKKFEEYLQEQQTKHS